MEEVIANLDAEVETDLPQEVTQPNFFRRMR